MSGTTLKLGVENQFDSYGRPKSTVYDFGGFTQKNTVNYVANSDLISSFYFQMQSTYNPYVSYTYDKLERLTNETFVEDDYEILKKAYTYYDGVDSTKTTNFIRTETFNGSSRHYLYEYDDLGNISRVIYNIQHDIKYTYDSLNQLVREDNTYANRSYTYEYDKAGNILYKRTYTYTMGTLGTPLSTDNYGYNNPAWGDLLTSYNGKTINYDAIGNPTNWRGYIDTLYWEGRRLSGIDVGSYYNSYYYNESGIRTRKSIWEDVSSELIDVSYIVDGSKILKETRTSNYYSTDTLYYYYDTNGSVTGFTLNGANYFYGKNIQGDIKYIYNVNGAFIAEYCYDAWGNLLSILDANGNILTSGTNYTIATTNPFRYRGYYYDTETGLFYVGSRYYDPEIGRWLSPEPNVDYGGFDEGAGLLAYNVYAYCANNPVNFFDPTGEFIITTTTLIVGGIIIGAIAGGSYGAYKSYKQFGKVKWTYVVGGAVVGGAIGGLVGWGAGAILTKFGVIGVASSITGGGGASFATFDKLKSFLGSPGWGKQWHHIVEQCQRAKSGFSNSWIQNSNNVINISKSVHQKISAHYSSKFDFTQGKTVRDWLAGQSFQKQYEYGVKILRKFGVKI